MDKTETPENGTKSIITLAVHSTPESTVKLVHEGKFSAPRLNSKPLENPTIPTEMIGKTGTKDDNGACTKGATSQPEVNLANKGISKPLTECLKRW